MSGPALLLSSFFGISLDRQPNRLSLNYIF